LRTREAEDVGEQQRLRVFETTEAEDVGEQQRLMVFENNIG